MDEARAEAGRPVRQEVQVEMEVGESNLVTYIYSEDGINSIS